MKSKNEESNLTKAFEEANEATHQRTGRRMHELYKYLLINELLPIRSNKTNKDKIKHKRT